MKAEILTIGGELLDGSVVDANAAYLGARLTSLGAVVERVTSVPDSVDVIESVLAASLESADLVITTGGLGVTADDRTKQAVSRLLGRKLVLNEDLLDDLRARFESRNEQMPESMIASAMLPEGSRPVPNARGTAPGLLFETEGALLFVLPGVPSELRSMFQNYVSPFLEGRGLKPLTAERLIRTTGLPETEVAERIEKIARRLARTDVAYLPSVMGVDVRITGRGATLSEAEKAAETSSKRLAAKLDPFVYARDDESMEKVVGYLLSMEEATLSVAESCTGGLIGYRLTRVPGSSDYFSGGVIAYSNDLKKRLLGVKQAVLRKHGAVSEEVAIAMAQGVRARCRSDYGLAVTGLAGPGGGSDSKPVGMVYVAVAWDGAERARGLRLFGGRGAVRRASAQAALELLRRALLRIEE
jgi:nicotinamide-nucleotide amidase